MRYLLPLRRVLQQNEAMLLRFRTVSPLSPPLASPLKVFSVSPSLSLRSYSDKIDRPEGLNKDKPKMDLKKKAVGPISWFNLGVSGVLIGVLMGFYYYARSMKEEALRKERKKAVGKAKIGGRFELVDHDGKVCKSEDFLGKWVFLYFGFTHCPDICPEEMEKIAEAVREDLNVEEVVRYSVKVNDLAVKAKDYGEVQPLFITVDPLRDGVKEVAEYVKEFHPKLIGLTGTEEQIKEACKGFRVYYSAGKIIHTDWECDEDFLILGPKDEDEDYIVDHTIIVYLINPDMEFVDYYGQTKDKEQIVNSTMLHMARYKQEREGGSGLASLFK